MRRQKRQAIMYKETRDRLLCIRRQERQTIIYKDIEETYDYAQGDRETDYYV